MSNLTPTSIAVGSIGIVCALAALGWAMGPDESPKSQQQKQQQQQQQQQPSMEQLLQMLQMQKTEQQRGAQQRPAQPKDKPRNTTKDQLSLGPSPSTILDTADANAVVAYVEDLMEKFQRALQDKQFDLAVAVGKSLLSTIEEHHGVDSDWFAIADVLSRTMGQNLKPESRKELIDLMIKYYQQLLDLEGPEAIGPIFELGMKFNFMKVYDQAAACTFSALDKLITSAADPKQVEGVFRSLAPCVSTAFNYASRIGSWNAIDAATDRLIRTFPIALYKERLEFLYDPYVAALHQQGRTREGIDFMDLVALELKPDEDGPEKWRVYNWCVARAAKFHFYLDQFESSVKKLEELRLLCTNTERNLAARDLLELSTSYRELGNQEAADEAYNSFLTTQPSYILTRSRYVLTSKYKFEKDAETNEMRYELVLMVCRTPPARKEGEYDPDEEHYERKLNNYHLVVTFENPDVDGEPLISKYDVTEFSINITSPSFSTAPEKNKWYSVKMELYDSIDKDVRLGYHYQPVAYLEK